MNKKFIVPFGLILLATLFLAAWFIAQRKLTEAVVEAGLPGRFVKIQKRLQSLSLKTPRDNLNWLRAPLLHLAVVAPNLPSLGHIPPTLRTLRLKKTALVSLQGLESADAIETVVLEANQQLVDLFALGELPNLTTLRLYGNGGAIQIPWGKLTSLEILVIEGESFDLSGLLDLPKLRELTLNECQWVPTDLSSLDALQRLTMENMPLKALPLMPHNITTLILADNRELKDYAHLPSGLQHLESIYSGFDPAFIKASMPNLTWVRLHWTSNTGLKTLASCAPGIVDLGLVATTQTDLDNLSQLWPQLLSLDLDDLPNISNLDFLSTLKLESLRIKGCFNLEDSDLAAVGLHTSLLSLTLDNTWVKILDLEPLELKTLELRFNEFLEVLAGLEGQKQLCSLKLFLCDRLEMELPRTGFFEYEGRDQWFESHSAAGIQMGWPAVGGCIGVDSSSYLKIKQGLVPQKQTLDLTFLSDMAGLNRLDLSEIDCTDLPILPDSVDTLAIKVNPQSDWGNMPEKIIALDLIIE